MKNLNHSLVVLFVLIISTFAYGAPIDIDHSRGVLPGEVSCSEHYTSLPEELRDHMSMSEALEEVDSIAELEASLDEVRKSNGRFVRQAKVKRDTKLAELAEMLPVEDDLSQAINEFRFPFLKVEKAYVTILSHREFFKQLHNNPDPEVTDQQWIRQVLKMENELREAYKDLGGSYVEYVQARRYLEDIIADEDSPANLRENATYVFSKLGIKTLSKALPALGVDENFRPSLQEVSDLFWSNTAPVVALLKNDLKQEKKLRLFKNGLAIFIGFQKAIMSLDKLSIGSFKVGSMFRTLVSSLLLLSRDQYLKAEHLDNVGELVQDSRDIDAKTKFLMKLCDSRCDEFLETFARVKPYGDNWIELRDHMQTKSEKLGHQYKSVYKLMLEAQGIADEKKGLSLNYTQLGDGQGQQFLMSSAAITFWVTIFNIEDQTWAAGWNHLAEAFAKIVGV